MSNNTISCWLLVQTWDLSISTLLIDEWISSPPSYMRYIVLRFEYNFQQQTQTFFLILSLCLFVRNLYSRHIESRCPTIGHVFAFQVNVSYSFYIFPHRFSPSFWHLLILRFHYCCRRTIKPINEAHNESSSSSAANNSQYERSWTNTNPYLATSTTTKVSLPIYCWTNQGTLKLNIIYNLRRRVGKFAQNEAELIIKLFQLGIVTCSCVVTWTTSTGQQQLLNFCFTLVS